jgi:outer membrane protein TolC
MTLGQATHCRLICCLLSFYLLMVSLAGSEAAQPDGGNKDPGGTAYELSQEGNDLKSVFPKSGEPGAQLGQTTPTQESDTDQAAAAPPAVAKNRVPATALVSVTAEASSDTAVIHVEADGALQKYKSHIPSEDPPRIVFDFPGIRSPYKAEQRIAVKTGPVSQVRHFAHADKVRLVIETQRSYLGNYTAEIVDNGLLIRVGDAAGSKSRNLKTASGQAQSQAPPPANPAAASAVSPAPAAAQKNTLISERGSGEKAYTLELTIEQAVEMALQKNRAFQTARRSLSAAASSYRSALSQYYPTITGGLTGSYAGSHSGAQGATTGIDKLISSGLEIGASLPLDLSGAINRSVQQALNSLLISKAQYVSASQDLVVLVYNEYYSALRANETIAINKAQVEYARDQLKIAEANLRAGRVPEVDVLTAKVQLRNEEQNLKASEGDYEIRLANLKNTLLLDQQTKVIPVSKLEYVPELFNYEASVEEGMQKRLEVKIAELNVENAKIALKSTYDPYRPTLNVTGSYGYAVSGPNASDAWDSRPDEPSWAATASISVPIFIFDGGATRESITRANISVSQAQSDFDQVKDDIQLEIRNEVTSLENSSERVKIMQDSAALAKESLRITELRYQLGKTNYLELTNARNNLRQSELNYLDALIEYNLSKIRFDRALGRPLVN